MIILIPELQFGGHYFEYVKHLFERIAKGDSNQNKYLFYLNPKFSSTVISSLVGKSNCIEVNYFSDYELEKYTGLDSANKSKFIFNFLMNLYEEKSFDHVLFLNINLILRSKLVINPFRKYPFSFSGVFFQSPYFLKSMGISKFFTRVRREFILKILSINVNSKDIYLLNDKKGAEFYSKWSQKIKFIPDPVNLVSPANIDIKDYHNLPNDFFIFLHIGALGLYKGTDLVLDSILNLDYTFFSSSRFIFVGRMSEKLLDKVKIVNNFFNENVIICRNEYVEEDVFSSYLYQADCVVIVNRNVESSSGILNHSLVRKKVIIAPSKGYFKDRLLNYPFCFFFLNVLSLKEAYLKALNHKSRFENDCKFDIDAFYIENSPLRFSSILLKIK